MHTIKVLAFGSENFNISLKELKVYLNEELTRLKGEVSESMKIQEVKEDEEMMEDEEMQVKVIKIHDGDVHGMMDKVLKGHSY